MKISKILFFLSALLLFSCTTEEMPEEPVSPEFPAAPDLLTGQFMENPVEGLIFRSESQEGVTNTNGEFKYVEGEIVEFFVGDIKVGEAIGNNKLTPVDIAETPNASVNSEEVKNIAAFLQTLDIDNNPDNGIKISSEVVEAISITEINFQEPIITTLGEIALEVNMNTLAFIDVVFPEHAALHLAETLGENYEVSGLEAGPFYNVIDKFEIRANTLQWIHEFDSQGRISKSTGYLRYPFRVAFVNNYSEYNADGYPLQNASDRISENGSTPFTLYFFLDYSREGILSKIGYGGRADAAPSSSWWEIEEFDSKMRMTKVVTYSDSEPVGTEYFEYDDQNNSTKIRYFDQGSNEPKIASEYHYTSFGSLASYKSITNYSTLEYEYFYRDNYFQEKTILVEQRPSEPEHKTILYYDENGIFYKRELFSADFLYELAEKNTDGSSKITFYDEEDGSYYIEYSDSNNQKYKTEYYDSEGNLIGKEE